MACLDCLSKSKRCGDVLESSRVEVEVEVGKSESARTKISHRHKSRIPPRAYVINSLLQASLYT